MSKMYAIALVCLVLQVQSSLQQLDCESQIRLIIPELFAHCNCKYSNWSDWEVQPGSTTNNPNCPSGRAYSEIRTRDVISGQGCDMAIDIRTICMPDKSDQLILSLGLGSTGIDHSPLRPADTPGPPRTTQTPPPTTPTPSSNATFSGFPGGPTGRQKRQTCGGPLICREFTDLARRKRHLRYKGLQRRSRSSSYPKPSDTGSEEAPLPFNWSQHHQRFRRQTDCAPNGVQYILFLLDASGSIGIDSFRDMTEAVSRMNAFFCKATQIAVMTFNHAFKLGFCFNQFDNTCAERGKASDAIRNIEYCAGFTHTAGATLCACHVLLSQACGLPPTASCISVVYITDGRSNDPVREVCKEVRCLHNRVGVETFAIGIGNRVSQSELECIAGFSSTTSIFRFRDFKDFAATIIQAEIRLLASASMPSHLNNYKCVAPPNPLQTDGEPCNFN